MRLSVSSQLSALSSGNRRLKLTPVHLLQTIILHAALCHPQLSAVFAIPLIDGRRRRTSGISGRECVHIVRVAVGRGPDPVADDTEPSTGCPVEEQVEKLTLLLLIGHVCDQVCPLESQAETKSIHGLVCLGEVDSHCRSGLARSNVDRAGTVHGCRRGRREEDGLINTEFHGHSLAFDTRRRTKKFQLQNGRLSPRKRPQFKGKMPLLPPYTQKGPISSTITHHPLRNQGCSTKACLPLAPRQRPSIMADIKKEGESGNEDISRAANRILHGYPRPPRVGSWILLSWGQSADINCPGGAGSLIFLLYRTITGDAFYSTYHVRSDHSPRY